MKKPKRPRDPSQLAKMMVDIASGDDVKLPQPKKKVHKSVSKKKV